MNLSFFDKARGFVSEKATKRMLQLAGEGKTEELASLFRTISGFAPAKYHRESLALLADMIEADDPFFGFFKRIAREASPKCLEKLIQNLIVNFITLGRGIRDRKEKELGVHLPNFLVISPTMKCNLSCRGCYAGEYDTSEELSFDELDAILECMIEREMGPAETVAAGHDRDVVRRVFRLLDRAEYKRRQAPPGVKITARAFGRDRRYPIVNGFTDTVS